MAPCKQRRIMAKFTVEAFVEKAKNSHGNRYDYSKVTTRDEKGRVTIVCNVGKFLLTL